MMVNLFSIFDPSTSYMLSLNWLVILIVMMFLPMYYYVVPSYYVMSLNFVVSYMYNEFKLFLKCNYSSYLFSVMMYFIFIFNFVGLFPFIFTLTSHMVFTVSFALSLWLCYMFYGWINFYNLMFSHLVPQGTPFMLMFFMVLIETISNIIRPLTLSVRLGANMIAGHLLLCLIGNLGPLLNEVFLFSLIIIQLCLYILELGVSLIQAYVFSVLSSLYSSEVEMEDKYFSSYMLI
uniref:ATP synthase subunit a n=1 Tax=Agenioideus sp. SJW-2017 TaxID=1940100 RepID=A0A1P8VH81_9HYME|nr:ATP synthase F0 subunit 6 [Agenioideus sp. SJW-2017]